MRWKARAVIKKRWQREQKLAQEQFVNCSNDLKFYDIYYQE